MNKLFSDIAGITTNLMRFLHQALRRDHHYNRQKLSPEKLGLQKGKRMIFFNLEWSILIRFVTYNNQMGKIARKIMT